MDDTILQSVVIVCIVLIRTAMLKQSQCRQPLLFLTVCLVIALCLNIVPIVYMIVKNYIGFLMAASMTFLCNTYLTMKYHLMQEIIFSIMFVSVCLGFVLSLISCGIVIRMLCTYKDLDILDHVSNKYVSKGKFVALYVIVGFTLLALVVSLGYVVGFIVQVDIYCLGYLELDWIIIGSALLCQFIVLIVCFVKTALVISHCCEQDAGNVYAKKNNQAGKQDNLMKVKDTEFTPINYQRETKQFKDTYHQNKQYVVKEIYYREQRNKEKQMYNKEMYGGRQQFEDKDNQRETAKQSEYDRRQQEKQYQENKAKWKNNNNEMKWKENQFIADPLNVSDSSKKLLSKIFNYDIKSHSLRKKEKANEAIRGKLSLGSFSTANNEKQIHKEIAIKRSPKKKIRKNNGEQIYTLNMKKSTKQMQQIHKRPLRLPPKQTNQPLLLKDMIQKQQNLKSNKDAKAELVFHKEAIPKRLDQKERKKIFEQMLPPYEKRMQNSLLKNFNSSINQGNSDRIANLRKDIKQQGMSLKNEQSIMIEFIRRKYVENSQKDEQ